MDFELTDQIEKLTDAINKNTEVSQMQMIQLSEFFKKVETGLIHLRIIADKYQEDEGIEKVIIDDR